MITVPKLTLEDVKVLLAAAESEARAIGVDVDIAVVDDGGQLLGFYRMDKAKITGIQIAIDKAFTAAGARKATHEYAAMASPGASAFGIHVSNGGRFMIFGGGVPIFVAGQIVGGVGISSGSSEQDRAVAEAAVDALLCQLRKSVTAQPPTP
ncbi:MAG: heme-binding protein [Acidobacteria bacterium]|nr:heme-binding protein [Acidobacteriota bacterium]MBI3656769.1 heme-binding protein [Acidobacteriota bacterium]